MKIFFNVHNFKHKVIALNSVFFVGKFIDILTLYSNLKDYIYP